LILQYDEIVDLASLKLKSAHGLAHCQAPRQTTPGMEWNRMKPIAAFLLATYLLTSSSCTAAQSTNTPLSPASSIAPTTLHSGTPTVDAKATLFSSDPSIEVSFDGNECIVDGPSEVPTGAHVFVFRNTMDHPVFLVPVRHYEGNSWEDALDWVEENCGPPGTFCDVRASWMAGVAYEKSAFDGLVTRYQQYDLAIEAEYSLWAETSGGRLWPCGPVFVVGND
jgi:hypothetical protein